MAKRATRHNGRAGKNGVYSPKHNDRDFGYEETEHIDAERTHLNVLWDCYHGLYRIADKAEDETKRFEWVEQTYYKQKYSDGVDAQHERNRIAGHSHRDRTTDDIRLNRKTCPEETLLQIGKMDDHADSETLAMVACEYFQEFDKRFGEHVHILNWALHLDESTPHIHERHVFDCKDQYGYVLPQQEKALEQLGIPLPFPDEKKSKFNNRKMKFDSICRTLFIDIAKKYGIEIIEEPLYGGREYLEKQDYILAQQAEKLAQQEQRLDEVTLKILEAETLIDEVANVAYEKACEVVSETAGVEAHEHSMKVIDEYKDWLGSPEREAPKEKRNYAIRRIEAIQEKLKASVSNLLVRVAKRLADPIVKEKNTEAIKEKTRVSIRELLRQKQEELQQEAGREKPVSRKQNMEL